jgi:hypothetical protein
MQLAKGSGADKRSTQLDYTVSTGTLRNKYLKLSLIFNHGGMLKLILFFGLFLSHSFSLSKGFYPVCAHAQQG